MTRIFLTALLLAGVGGCAQEGGASKRTTYGPPTMGGFSSGGFTGAAGISGTSGFRAANGFSGTPTQQSGPTRGTKMPTGWGGFSGQ